MDTFSDYSLLDFGDGRRLERFGPLTVERPCPAAQGIPRAERNRPYRDVQFIPEKALSRNAALGERGRWEALTPTGREFFFDVNEEGAAASKAWTIRHAEPDFTLELTGSPFGHLGVFPEQAANWSRIFRLCVEGKKRLARPLRVLNLFAYTGAGTLAAAAGNASVVHLDAARNSVERAKRNAELSGLADAVRFIADDAVKFVRREKKRGNGYDGIILDPPSYGHGARGEVWRLARDLPDHLTDVFSLLADDFPFALLSCHTAGFESARLAQLLRNAAKGRFGKSGCFRIESGPMAIEAQDGRKLSAGDFALLSCR